MNKNYILNCCSSEPEFIIDYNIGSKYLVCSNCIKLQHWSRSISKKELIKK